MWSYNVFNVSYTYTCSIQLNFKSAHCKVCKASIRASKSYVNIIST